MSLTKDTNQSGMEKPELTQGANGTMKLFARASAGGVFPICACLRKPAAKDFALLRVSVPPRWGFPHLRLSA
jgi:hypothetical protein